MTTEAYAISAARTPVVPYGGSFNRVEVHLLAAPVLNRCLRDAKLLGEQIDEVILGNALYGGGNPARVASLEAGFPERIGGLTIDRQCCSGLDAVILAAQLIRSGSAHAVLAGGAESFSRRPIRQRTDPDTRQNTPYDRPPFTPWPDRDPDLHSAAAALAQERNISRATQDAWAISSHARAMEARSALAVEIVRVAGCEVQHDAFTRLLSPRVCERAGVLEGTITSANTAVAADAAAFVLLVSEQVWMGLGRPFALRVSTSASLGGDPERPQTAPVAAIRQVLRDRGITPAEIARAEIMEAYAVQCIACVADSGLDLASVNTGGGALARGHPIGASGAILAVRLFHQLQKSGGIGLAAIAGAGGLGSALLLEA